MSELLQLVEGPGQAPARNSVIRQIIRALARHLAQHEAEARTHATVTVVAELPASASPRDLYRVAGDPNIYIGGGAGQPLRRIPTQPL